MVWLVLPGILAVLLGTCGYFLKYREKYGRLLENGIAVFVILMDRVFIRVEEQMFEKRFGQIWLEYAQQVRRWV